MKIGIKTGRYILLIVCFWGWLSVFGLVFAGEKTIEYTLEGNYENCIFEIKWENGDHQAYVRVVSPLGTVFGTEDSPDRVSEREGMILINVGKAPVGQWEITVKGDQLGTVEVSGGELPTNFEIESLNVEQDPDSNDYVLTCSVSHDRGGLLKYEVYLDEDDEGYDGMLIKSFKDDASGTFKLNSEYLDRKIYHLYVKVSDPTGVFDIQYYPEALYMGQRITDAPINVQANRLNGDVFLRWDDSMWAGDLFVVMLFDFETKALLAKEMTSGFSYAMGVPQGYERVFAAVASYDDYVVGPYDLFQIDFTQAAVGEIVFPEFEKTNQNQMDVSIAFDNPANVYGYVNGVCVIDGEEKARDYRLELKEGDNEIVMFVEDINGDMVTATKKVYVDTIPPQFSLTEAYDGHHTKQETIFFDGYTEAGATVTLNDQVIEKTGAFFDIEQPLKYGENQFQWLARDIVGNETKRQVRVYRDYDYEMWLKAGALLAVGVALIVVYTLKWKRLKGGDSGENGL